MLVASLAAGWFLVSRHASAGAPPTLPDAPAIRAHGSTDAAPGSNTAALRARLAPGLTCTDVAAAAPTVDCSVDRVDVVMTLLGPAADETYRARSHTGPHPAAGAPACAGGKPEERAWSRPAAPARTVGRYRCTFEHGRAAMWWTDAGLLAHAVAPDADLAHLFAWWRTFDT